MSKISNRFSPEVRERAVRMVGEHRAGYASEWAAQAPDDKARLKLLDREVKALRRANEILRKASAYFCAG
jgi:transposase